MRLWAGRVTIPSMKSEFSDSVSSSPADKGGEAEATDARSATQPARKKKSLFRRLFSGTLFLLYVLVLAEIASRAYWRVKHRERGMPFFPAWSDWVDRFYEEVRDSGVCSVRPQRDDAFFDVLLLGGSALDRVYDSLADASAGRTLLPDRLRDIVHRPVRVFNLAHPGMTTRDSLLKYRMLAEEGLHFDLVVIYHAINDVRMNNIAAEKFRDDYTHSGFYRQFQRLRAYRPLLPYFTLPYTLEYTAIHVLSSRKFGVYLPRHRPGAEQLSHSAEIKTDRPFRRNVEEILNGARSRGEPVLLLTFAWYLPADYTAEKCRTGRLDYAPSPRPSLVEMWGSIDGVVKGIQTHNDVIRRLAGEHPEILFVDADRLVPKRGEFFHDICHLSESGKVQLMEAFLPAIARRFSPAAADGK